MIHSQVSGDVVLLTLDRKERRNALDVEHCDALRAAVQAARAAGARVLVITGSGSSFCSGADFDEVYGPDFLESLYAMLRAIRDVPMPVIAAVNGPAIGAGTQLAIACDLRVAAARAVFRVPTARIGLAVDPWTIRRLAGLAGSSVASAMLLGCDAFDAESAQRFGLVNRVGDLAAALDWAGDIATMAPLTLEYSKRVLQTPAAATAEADLLDAFERCWSSDDLREGELARREKRSPRFRGT